MIMIDIEDEMHKLNQIIDTMNNVDYDAINDSDLVKRLKGRLSVCGNYYKSGDFVHANSSLIFIKAQIKNIQGTASSSRT